MSRNTSTDELYFITLTVAYWIDVFTNRKSGGDILLYPFLNRR